MSRFLLIMFFFVSGCSSQIIDTSLANAEDVSGLEEQALLGDANASLSVGMYYMLAANNTGRAEPWLRLAADLGSVDAQLNLGLLYQDRNQPELALRYIAMAAGTGDLVGLSRLAEMLEASQEYASARVLYSRAAKLGDLNALTKVSEMEILGTGGQQDLRSSLGHLKAASKLVDEGSILADKIDCRIRVLESLSLVTNHNESLGDIGLRCGKFL